VNEERPQKTELKRSLKIALFRAWAAGAVCFFGAWGRSGSEEAGYAFSLNLIAGLIVIMIICDLIIVNPVIRLATGRKIFGDEKKGWRLFLGGPLHAAKVAALIILIMETYYFLNVFFIRAFGMEQDTVAVPLEPVLFGILYGLYYLLFDFAGKLIVNKLFRGNNEKPIYQKPHPADE
jgi:hypothetical protein